MSNLSVALLIITDGREDYLERTLASARQMLPDNFGARIVISDKEHQLGFAGAIQAGWEKVLDTKCRWVFHLEDDFIFNAPVPAAQMIEVLSARGPELAQISLKRQPVNERETAAGGIVEMAPQNFDQQTVDADGESVVITEHRSFFTTNPSIYPATLCKRGWPQERYSEGVFTHQLLADGHHFAIWGRKFDPPAVEHIGAMRAGHGY